MTARTFNCSYHGLEQQEQQKGIPASQLFNCTTGTHLATRLNHSPYSLSHTKELLSLQPNSYHTHSAARPPLGFSSTWLYNLIIFLKNPMVWKKSATHHKSHQISNYVPSDKPRPCDSKKSANLLWKLFSGLCSIIQHTGYYSFYSVEIWTGKNDCTFCTTQMSETNTFPNKKNLT